jgi:hypothetical protein
MVSNCCKTGVFSWNDMDQDSEGLGGGRGVFTWGKSWAKVGQMLEVEYCFAGSGSKQKVLFTEGGIAKIFAFFENSDTSIL